MERLFDQEIGPIPELIGRRLTIVDLQNLHNSFQSLYAQENLSSYVEEREKLARKTKNPLEYIIKAVPLWNHENIELMQKEILVFREREVNWLHDFSNELEINDFGRKFHPRNPGDWNLLIRTAENEEKRQNYLKYISLTCSKYPWADYLLKTHKFKK